MSYIISQENEETALKVLSVIDNVSKEDKYGYTYLTIACSEHKAKVVEKLFELGADPNHKDNPLLDALGRRNKNNSKILELFIKYGVDLSIVVNGATIEEAIRSFEEDEWIGYNKLDRKNVDMIK